MIEPREFNDGRRKRKLNKQEKSLISKDLQYQEIALMLLDLENNYTHEEIANKLEISVPTLQRWMSTPEFDETWTRVHEEIQTHPLILATRKKMVGLLPKAMKTLAEQLDSSSDTVALRAALKIIEMAGADKSDGGKSNRTELAEFLGGIRGVQVNNIQMDIPQEYVDAMERHIPMSEDVVDAEFDEEEEE